MPTDNPPIKARLVEAMTGLLQTQGYNATGVNEILEASQAPKGSLYHHFPGGKTELAAAAVDEARQRILRNLQRLKEQGRDPVRVIHLFVDFYIRQMQASHYAQGCPIATVTLETAATVDLLQSGVKQFFDELVEFVAAMLEEQGLDSDVAQSQAVVIVSIIEGALILSRAQRSPQPLITARDYITTQLQSLFSGLGEP
jgi:TetR/AcrR family transcriptional repressor of lmrAB and yxaGH operons